MASEIPPVDELSDNDRNSENDYHTPIDVRDPPIADEISQLKLDVDEVRTLCIAFDLHSRA